MLKTPKLQLNKPEGTDVVNIEDLNANMDTLDTEVTKLATPSADGRMSKGDKAKLNELPSGADFTQLSNSLTTHLAEFAQHIEDESAHGIGDKSALKTVEKGTIVNALNELFTNVSDGKQLIGTAITDLDDKVNVPNDPTFQQLADAISRIETGKKWATGTFTHVSKTQGHTIAGLEFKPSIVVGYDTSGNITGRAGGFFAYYGLLSAVKIGYQTTFIKNLIHASSNGFYIDEAQYDPIVPMSFNWIAIE